MPTRSSLNYADTVIRSAPEALRVGLLLSESLIPDSWRCDSARASMGCRAESHVSKIASAAKNVRRDAIPLEYCDAGQVLLS